MKLWVLLAILVAEATQDRHQEHSTSIAPTASEPSLSPIGSPTSSPINSPTKHPTNQPPTHHTHKPTATATPVPTRSTHSPTTMEPTTTAPITTAPTTHQPTRHFDKDQHQAHVNYDGSNDDHHTHDHEHDTHHPAPANDTSGHGAPNHGAPNHGANDTSGHDDPHHDHHPFDHPEHDYEEAYWHTHDEDGNVTRIGNWTEVGHLQDHSEFGDGHDMHEDGHHHGKDIHHVHESEEDNNTHHHHSNETDPDNSHHHEHGEHEHWDFDEHHHHWVEDMHHHHRPKDCSGEWTEWSTCSACRGGKQSRILGVASGCPQRSQNQTCTLTDDQCVFKWSCTEWSACRIDEVQCVEARDKHVHGYNSRTCTCFDSDVSRHPGGIPIVADEYCAPDYEIKGDLYPRLSQDCLEQCPALEEVKRNGDGSTLGWMFAYSFWDFAKHFFAEEDCEGCSP